MKYVRAFALITTPNGKVGGFLQTGEALPLWLKTWINANHPSITDPLEFPWNNLQVAQQLQLIEEISRLRNQNFFKDRTIAGLVTQPVHRLEFAAPTRFLGTDYPAGSHLIDLTSVLSRKVEYVSPSSIQNFRGIELHFRANESAGNLSNDAWKFQEGLRISKTHQHVHVVAPLPVEFLAKDPVMAPVVIGDFFKRANLAAEMLDVVHQGYRIESSKNAKVTFFDFLQPKQLKGVTHYFQQVAEGKSPPIGDQFKMGWVGMRGHDKYDLPNLWGLEFRSVHSNSNKNLVKEFLNGVQYAMDQKQFGVTPSQIRSWQKAFPAGDLPTQLSQSLYHQEWDALLLQLSPTLSAKRNLIETIQTAPRFKYHEEVKMLAFDWSKDPFFFNKPALVKKIEYEQARAIQRLQQSHVDPSDVMGDFLLNSGLYESVLRSVGVKLERF